MPSRQPAWSQGRRVSTVPGVTVPPRPLAGRRIVVTRPHAQAGELAARLEAHGAEVVRVPAIRLEPPDDWAPLDDALRAIEGFRWIVFTSVNGVAALQERLARMGLGAEHLAGRRVAAIGPETAAALRRAGVEPEVVPAEYRAEALVEALGRRVAAGDTLLLVRATEARDVLPRELTARGVRVTVAPAYRTRVAREGAAEVVSLLESGQVDAVTFTSSSTVRGFVALLAPGDARQLLDGVTLAAIGPVTAETMEAQGLRVDVMPRDYTIPALADAIAAHFEGTRPRRRPH